MATSNDGGRKRETLISSQSRSRSPSIQDNRSPSSCNLFRARLVSRQRGRAFQSSKDFSFNDSSRYDFFHAISLKVIAINYNCMFRSGSAHGSDIRLLKAEEKKKSQLNVDGPTQMRVSRAFFGPFIAIDGVEKNKTKKNSKTKFSFSKIIWLLTHAHCIANPTVRVSLSLSLFLHSKALAEKRRDKALSSAARFQQHFP